MRVLRKDDPSSPMVEVEPADLERAMAGGGWLWIDLVGPDQAEVEELAGRFAWDPLTVEDVLDDRPLSKFADHGEYLFVVVHALGEPGARVSTIELDLYLAKQVLVSISHQQIPEVVDLIDESKRTAGVSMGGPDAMLSRLIASVGRRYLPLLDAVEERVVALEDQAVAADPAVIPEVQALRRDLTRLRRFVAPQREVMMALTREDATPLIDRRARLRCADVHEQLYRTVESLDSARVLLASVLETYRSAVAEDMNRVMKVLTVFSAIILPLGLIAGIYGMNFDVMPELRHPRGYFYALGLMGLVAAGLWIWFRRAGFVGGPRLRDLPKAVGLGLLQMAILPVKGIGAVVKSVGSLVEGSENRGGK